MTFPALTGVIEGFYGREWSWSLRGDYADFLSRCGLNSYLYCPKSDAHLRKRWREDWPAPDSAELRNLSATYRARNLHWGVGLSPFALYLDYSAAQKQTLRARIEQINALEGSLLAILFDDMPGDCPDLAARQAEIVGDVLAWSEAQHLLVCPTYYSLDPVLEQHFGARPEDYWAALGRELPPGVGIFWTGNRVCSPSVSRSDLEEISGLLRRPVVLWDNYPVNDGAKGCKFLNLAPLPAREAGLEAAVSGHFCNPMNQGLLSQYPLTGLGALYGGPAVPVESLFSSELAAALLEDRAMFQDLGLDGIKAEDKVALAARYAAMDDPAGAEVAQWLRGEYAFDPACLTG